jgi:DNA-binding protein HU-beta
MNKKDMIDAVARTADISKAAAERAIDAVMATVKTELRKGDTVTLAGFGTFLAVKRAARTVRNPRTGEPVTTKASVAPRFRPGKALKDALN